MKVRRSLLKDVVDVETYAGESAYGPLYKLGVSASCNVDSRRRLVRNPNGLEVVSETTLIVHPDDVALFTPESRVTIAERQSSVLLVKPHTFRGKLLHVEVACS